MDKVSWLLEIAQPYGVKGIHFGGCVTLNYKGTPTAMRRKAHAHWLGKGYIDSLKKHHPERLKDLGWICFKQFTPEKRAISSNGKPSQLFWHEVAHIYRSSWTEGQCDKWAWKKQREYD